MNDDLDYLDELENLDKKEPEKTQEQIDYESILPVNEENNEDDSDIDLDSLSEDDIQKAIENENNSRKNIEDDFYVTLEEEDQEEDKKDIVEEKKEEVSDELLIKKNELERKIKDLKESIPEKIFYSKPIQTDFSDEGTAEYERDLILYHKNQEITSNLNKLTDELIETEHQYSNKEFTNRLNEVVSNGKSTYKNFEDKLKVFSEIQNEHKDDEEFLKGTYHLDSILLDKEFSNSHDLVYYFANKPEAYKELVKKSKTQQEREVAKLSLRLELKRNDMKANKEKVNEVIKPLTNSNVSKPSKRVSSNSDISDMSSEEYDQWLINNFHKLKFN